MRDRAALLSATFLLLLMFAAVFADRVAPYHYSEADLLHTWEGPSAAHLLGTDGLGRDVLSRVIYGARISLTVGFVAEAIIILIGVTVGLVVGYAGGYWDMLVMRLVDALYAFPDLLFIIIIMTYLKGSLGIASEGIFAPLGALNGATGGLIGVFIALGLTSWLTTARLVRAQTLALKQREFVAAARCVGGSPGWVIRRHVLPNVLAPVIVAATFGIPHAMLLESSLSFLGLGVDPPLSSWGLMISDGIIAIQSYPHLLVPPCLALAATLLAFNFVGDGMRDALDPWLRR